MKRQEKKSQAQGPKRSRKKPGSASAVQFGPSLRKGLRDGPQSHYRDPPQKKANRSEGQSAPQKAGERSGGAKKADSWWYALKKAVCGVRCRSTAPKKPGAVLERPLGVTPRKQPSDATGQRAPKKPGARWLCRKSRHWKNAERKARRLNVRSSRHGPCKKSAQRPRRREQGEQRHDLLSEFCQKRIKALLIMPAHHPTVKSRIKDLNVRSVLRKPREKPRYPSHGTKKPERGEPRMWGVRHRSPNSRSSVPGDKW